MESLLTDYISYNSEIQFTLKKSINNSLNFLDMTLNLIGDKIITNWYGKDCSSDRTLNFLSAHPIQHKMSVVYGLVDRAMKLSDKEFHNTNLNKVRKLLEENNYPKLFVRRCINKRLRVLSAQSQADIADTQHTDNEQTILILYVPKIQNKFKKECLRSNNKL